MERGGTSRDYANNERRRQADPVSLQFLNFSHPSQVKTSASRRAIRSHVSRVQHQQTTAKRFMRPELRKLERAPKSHEGSDGEDSLKSPVTYALTSDAGSTPSTPSTPTELRSRQSSHAQLPIQLSALNIGPSTTNDPSLKWAVDIPSLIDSYLNRARQHLVSQGLGKVARSVNLRSIEPQLFLDGFLFIALNTITVTSVPVQHGRQQCDPMITWLRSNFLLAIQKVLSTKTYAPRVVATGIALLVAWEMEVGDPSLCQIHLKALPSVMKNSARPKQRYNGLAYRDPGDGLTFQAGAEIPPGFEFYRSQNLLPPSLMFHVGSLIHWDNTKPGASRWMRELWISIGACGPGGDEAQIAVKDGTTSTRIALLVRQAGIMLGSLMRSSAGESPVAQPQVSGIQAQWHSLLDTEWASLIGTVYDDVLLWCLCVFSTTTGNEDVHQLDAILSLLVRLDIRSPEHLSAFLDSTSFTNVPWIASREDNMANVQEVISPTPMSNDPDLSDFARQIMFVLASRNDVQDLFHKRVAVKIYGSGETEMDPTIWLSWRQHNDVLCVEQHSEAIADLGRGWYHPNDSVFVDSLQKALLPLARSSPNEPSKTADHDMPLGSSIAGSSALDSIVCQLFSTSSQESTVGFACHNFEDRQRLAYQDARLPS